MLKETQFTCLWRKSEHQVLYKQRSKMDNMRSFKNIFTWEKSKKKEKEAVQQFVVIGERENIMKMTMGNRNSDKGGLLIFFKHFKYAIFTLFCENLQ